MLQIARQLIISFFLILICINSYGINTNDTILKVKKTLCLEICNKNYYNICYNSFPESISKIPEFINYKTKIKRVVYDTIYRFPSIQIIEDFNVDKPLELLNYFDSPFVKTDTLKIVLSKISKKNIRRHLTNVKHKRKLKFNGKLNYLIYHLDFECVNAGEQKRFVINENKGDEVIEKNIKVFYITKINECKGITLINRI